MSQSSALPATTPSDTWFGCFTGDCPHGTRAECDAAIRAEFAHLARENARVHWLLVRAESGLENWGRHHPWCVTSQRSPCNCGYQTLLDDLSTGVSPSEGSAPDTPKLDTSAELEALADDVTLRPRKGSYYFRVVTPDGGAIAMHLPKDRVTDSGRLLFERIHEALLAALGLRAAEKAAEPQRIVDV